MTAAVADFQAPDFQADESETQLSGTKADTLRCESLRISYKDPTLSINERLTEDVFLDPRDSWCGPGGLLFVTANALTALQKGLDKQYNYFRGTQESIDTCRHDYIRELQYLMSELTTIRQQNPRSGQQIDELLNTVTELREERAEAETAGNDFELDKEELNAIAATCGTRDESDEPLIHHLEMTGLNRRCEVTLRILLKQMHEAVDVLIENRDRLLKILGPLEEKASGTKIIEALLNAAKGEGASICDLILAIQDHIRDDEGRQALEDMVTHNLRTKYKNLEVQYAELQPLVLGWRGTLAASEEREAELFYLGEEATELDALVKARTEVENKKKEAWEAKNDPKKKALLVQMKAMDSSNMSKDDSTKMASMALAEENTEREMAAVRAAMEKCEADRETYFEEKAALQDALPQQMRDQEFAEEEMMEAFESEQAAEAMEKKRADEERAMQKQRERMEDEYAAAQAPPPKNVELIRLEEAVEEAKERNVHLRVLEENIYERERKYEGLCVSTMNAWKEEEAAVAAAEAARLAEEAARLAAEAGGVSQERRSFDDPLSLKYYERCQLPEVSAQPRYVNLHTDKRARVRRYEKDYRDMLNVVGEKLRASAESVGVFGAASGAPKQSDAQIPVWFRRPEDLRVRLAGSEITVGHVNNILSEHQTHTAQLANNLNLISSQLWSYGAESVRLHAEARSHLSIVGGGGAGAEAGYPTNVLTQDLALALQEHQLASEHAEEAWQQAEHICERNLGEAEVVADERCCAVLERDLTAATRYLYATASQAASDATGPLGDAAKSCVLGLQAAEPQLAAAGAARGALWPRAAVAAHRLHWERQVQHGLESFLRDETTRCDLLGKELKAPSSEARRALSNMRAAMSANPLAAAAEPTPAAAP